MKGDAQISSGLRSVLSHPICYDLFQEVLGANQHRRKFYREHLNLQPDAKVLDIGCGTGILASIVPESIEYVGCDMEPRYIAYAKKQHRGRRTFLVEKIGDQMRAEWQSSFDVVNAHGLLHHLSDQDSDTLLKACHAYLKPGGMMYAVDGVYHDQQSSIRRWFISQDRGQHIRTPEEYKGLASRYFNSVEGFVDDKYTRILPYSVFIMIMQR